MTIEETLAEANKGAAVSVLSGICDIVKQWDEQRKELERLRERCGDLERELEGAYDKLDRVGNKLIDMAQRPVSLDSETAGNPSRNGGGCPKSDADGDFATESRREGDSWRKWAEDLRGKTLGYLGELEYMRFVRRAKKLAGVE